MLMRQPIGFPPYTAHAGRRPAHPGNGVIRKSSAADGRDSSVFHRWYIRLVIEGDPKLKTPSPKTPGVTSNAYPV